MYYLFDIAQARAKLKRNKKIIIQMFQNGGKMEFASPAGFPVAQAGAPEHTSETGAFGDTANSKIQNGGIRAIK